ncbi:MULTISPECIES: hypothetical protein [unclassified Pseudoxanthomonas]|uniref:hypothetical protein n=2 Tax=Pseudoxanthomonas TaxID=83618 RepID=UPI00184494C6|nr:drug/metabolite transporter (DMT)-like permease [Pseudoxanthomonas sp. OG2]
MSTQPTLMRRLGLGRMSTGEYQANLNGLNMFFGAVLGLVLTGTEKLDAWQFGVMLFCLAGNVITILFISSSRNRVSYAIFGLVNALLFPYVMGFLLRAPDLVPDKIQPTLLVWTIMTIVVEFWARQKEPEATAQEN